MKNNLEVTYYRIEKLLFGKIIRERILKKIKLISNSIEKFNFSNPVIINKDSYIIAATLKEEVLL